MYRLYNLSGNEITEYNKLCNMFDKAAQDGVSEVYYPINYKFTIEQYNKLLDLLYNVDSRYFWLENIRYTVATNKLHITYQYAIDYTQIENTYDTYLSIYKDACTKTVNMTDFYALKYFKETILKNCTYASDERLDTTAVGCIIAGKANCQGYAKALMYFCEQRNIPCEYVFGKYKRIEHIWNKVYIDDTWYYIDMTQNTYTLSKLNALDNAYIIYDNVLR